MTAEIEAAVTWWADQLREPRPSDNGDLQTELLKDTLASRLAPLDETTLEKFKEALRTSLPEFLTRNSWDVARAANEPNLGSYNRCLFCDYGPCRTLGAAADAAGITQLLLRFPMKACMWINPGCVTVRNGYRADQVDIYLAEPKPALGLEPRTARLQIECSTTELSGRTEPEVNP